MDLIQYSVQDGTVLWCKLRAILGPPPMAVPYWFEMALQLCQQ